MINYLKTNRFCIIDSVLTNEIPYYTQRRDLTLPPNPFFYDSVISNYFSFIFFTFCFKKDSTKFLSTSVGNPSLSTTSNL